MTEVRLRDIEFLKYHGLVKGVAELVDHLYELGFEEHEIRTFVSPMVESLVVLGGRNKK